MRGKFFFNVDGFGTYHEAGSAEAALGAYLHVMLDGMKAAEKWFELLRVNSAGPVPPRSLCGRKLQFGNFTFDMGHLSSPVVNEDPSKQHIGQCELFRIKVEMGDVRSQNPDGTPQVYWCLDADGPSNVASRVMVKVSSPACFGHLVGSAGFLWRIDESTWTKIQGYLSPSLHGVYVPPGDHGLVQVMPDLAVQGFEELRPKDLTEESSWKDMWCAFKALVTETLFPLAMAGVIHTDLRHGFDRTANIMYCKEAKQMRIVDWDSLMEFSEWRRHGPRGRKYIEWHASPLGSRDRPNAKEFVFLQVVCITESWLQGKDQSERSYTTYELIKRSEIAARWKESDQACDKSFIDAVLNEIGQRFESRDILAT
jgi:hypothetical protein